MVFEFGFHTSIFLPQQSPTSSFFSGKSATIFLLGLVVAFLMSLPQLIHWTGDLVLEARRLKKIVGS